MKRLRKYLLPSAIWLLVVLYIVWASHLARKSYSEATISNIEVAIVDSTADRRLVTGQMVRNWIARSGIETAGRPVNNIDLPGLERIVAANGFVGKVAAYTSTDGVLHLEVSQRTPLVRLLLDGYDRYVTDDGFVFGTPASSAIYVPVVTGSYKPQFPAAFEGMASAYCDTLVSGSNGIYRQIRLLRDQKAQLASERTRIKDDIEALRKERPRHNRFEGQIKKEWKDRKIEELNAAIKQKEAQLNRTAAEMTRLDKLMDAELASIKKTREKYEDFRKLLTFVERLESDDFWQSEIVQIVADRSSSGVLELKLVPRSGAFVIEFGDMANVDAKLSKLMKFYREGLRNLGWDEFSVVSVAYKGQVVCKKRK